MIRYSMAQLLLFVNIFCEKSTFKKLIVLILLFFRQYAFCQKKLIKLFFCHVAPLCAFCPHAIAVTERRKLHFPRRYRLSSLCFPRNYDGPLALICIVPHIYASSPSKGRNVPCHPHFAEKAVYFFYGLRIKWRQQISESLQGGYQS